MNVGGGIVAVGVAAGIALGLIVDCAAGVEVCTLVGEGGASIVAAVVATFVGGPSCDGKEGVVAVWAMIAEATDTLPPATGMRHAGKRLSIKRVTAQMTRRPCPSNRLRKLEASALLGDGHSRPSQLLGFFN